MKTVAEKCRRALKWCFGAFSITAVAFVFQACYGPAPAPDERAYHAEGRVLSSQTKAPLKGIKVTMKNQSFEYETDENGYFFMISDINSDDRYTLHFEDNGDVYQPKDTTVSSNTGKLEILLDEK